MSYAIDMQALRQRAATRVASRLTANPANAANAPEEISQLATLAVSHASADVATQLANEGSKVAGVAMVAAAKTRKGGNPMLTLEQGDRCHSPSWNDGEIQAFTHRRDRLLRWGYPEQDADDLAERLTLRDREHDERVSCTDCRHYRPGRCGNHRAAGLRVPDMGRDLAAMLQRCEGFTP